jgi:hypothetical protein
MWPVLLFISISVFDYLQATFLELQTLVHGNIHTVTMVMVNRYLKIEFLGQLSNYQC